MTDDALNQALDFIYSFIDYERSRAPDAKTQWDLRRVEELLKRLGNPHLKAKTVHIAGSKGKGSTAAMISSVLTKAGYVTGLYTSPHLHIFNERIRVDGKLISDEEIVGLVARLKPEVEEVNREAKYGRLTTFEIMTALGFYYFALKKVDFQVIEVGLGGRLDATNVVKPEVCVITSLSLEHTDILGDTLTAIAGEKAGIIKPNSIVVTSPQAEEADKVIESVCRKQKAKLIRVGRGVTYEALDFDDTRQSLIVHGRLGDYELDIPLLGDYQLGNASTAVAALEVLMEKGDNVPSKSIAEGMTSVEWEGRLQVLRRRPLLIADGAHNRDSVHKLKEALKKYFKFDKAVLIIGLSSDKDLAGIAVELAPVFDKVIVTRSTHPRAMETAPIAAEFRKYRIETEQAGDISIALPMALKLAGAEDMICVTGSLFVAAGAIESAEGGKLQ
ncbi:MAG: bifunctional folylpolyglutamate synthase/dihydrofolate synthase [Dehalococcoidales bacterium]|nr:bifunctional folylpolyglutamate synthase/dihydrofolate synthase [Dehalococcoidales bacterium]